MRFLRELKYCKTENDIFFRESDIEANLHETSESEKVKR